ncbi:ATP-dependent DNA helicase [Pyrofollis japonicus]|uniref:ATP-dependent DNA helicase n=1 Tax=Pyrofollis japonicus TaxID=3060460 RepID=UPI00295B7952|nr:ATP-dependent DNA helicase [Pyrofollis japonicus]BEP18278.1 ATP-dependent DNA helicase [Pyrofollis japonicus]
MPHAFPYDAPRRGQLEVAETIAKAVREGSIAAIRAPTGFGKTAATIKGLLDADVDRVLYVVRTRNEIRPVVRELRHFGIKEYVFLYSARRMCPLLEGEELGVEDFWNSCRLLRLRGECPFYASLAETSEDEVANIVNSSDRPGEVVAELAKRGLCPFFALKMLLSSSKFIVATYPYLFRQDIFETTFEPLSLGDFVVVIDEAHSLINIQSLLETRASIRDIENAIREIEEYELPEELGEKLRELIDLLAGIRASNRLKRLDKDKLRDILEEPVIWRDAAEEVRAEKIRERLESGAPISLRVYLSRIAELTASVWKEDTGAYVTASNGHIIIKVLPVDPCSIVGDIVENARAAVLLSGTLPDREALAELLCIRKNIRYLDVEREFGPVFPLEYLGVIVTAELTSRYRMRTMDMYRLYADYIVSTFKYIRKSLLAIYPSYEFMSNVVEAIKPRLEDDSQIIIEEQDTRIELVEEKVRARKHVLINGVAGGKLSEGVEILSDKGESLISTVFIAGVPYPQPDDYVEDQIRALSDRIVIRRAKTLFYEVTAAIRTLQAIGRARRGPGDAALIVLGDYRFMRQPLRKHLGILGTRYRVAGGLEEYKALVADAAKALDL